MCVWSGDSIKTFHASVWTGIIKILCRDVFIMAFSSGRYQSFLLDNMICPLGGLRGGSTPTIADVLDHIVYAGQQV